MKGNRHLRTLTLLLLLTTVINGYSQEKTHKSFLGIDPLSDTIETHKEGFFVLPLLYYTPDTRWAAGATGIYYFHLPPKEGQQETRSSYAQLLADYTQNKQLDILSRWIIFARDEAYLFKGELRFRNFPDRFYGLGNNSLRINEEKYSYNLFRLNSLMMKKIKKDLFFGINYEIEYEYGFEYKPGGMLESGNINGYKGGFGSALGLVIDYDSRDHIINAYKGTMAELATYVFGGYVGGQFNFTLIEGKFNKYFTLKKKHILATQTQMRLTIGDVPFLDMSTLGDDDILRGYASNRFRDKNFWATQVEYRFPIFWRFGGVAFAGVGDIFESTGDLQFSRLKYSFGGGIRFMIKPAERLNARLDYGYGREGGEFYFMVSEAF